LATAFWTLRVFLAHGFVTDDGHLAIAWGGDEGDDFAALEKTQDTLAGSAHERLDFLLRGRRARKSRFKESGTDLLLHGAMATHRE
jgi:hypothetical protein